MSVHFHQSNQHVVNQTNIGELNSGHDTWRASAQAIAGIDDLLRQIRGASGEAPHLVRQELLNAREEAAAGRQAAASSRLERTRSALSDAGSLASVTSALATIIGLLAG